MDERALSRESFDDAETVSLSLSSLSVFLALCVWRIRGKELEFNEIISLWDNLKDTASYWVYVASTCLRHERAHWKNPSEIRRTVRNRDALRVCNDVCSSFVEISVVFRSVL